MAKNNFENNYKPHGHLAKSIKRYFKVWDVIQYTCIYFWPTSTSTLGKGRKHLNMVWDTNLLHSWQGKSLKMFPCWVLQLFHKCPTNEWFDNRYNIRLWNCKNDSERVPGWPEGSLSTSNRPVKRQMRSINEFVWQDKTPVAFPSTLRNPRGQVPLTRQHVRQELRITEPHVAYEYTTYMNGVYRYDQLRMKYFLGRDNKKAWKIMGIHIFLPGKLRYRECIYPIFRNFYPTKKTEKGSLGFQDWASPPTDFWI